MIKKLLVRDLYADNFNYYVFNEWEFEDYDNDAYDVISVTLGEKITDTETNNLRDDYYVVNALVNDPRFLVRKCSHYCGVRAESFLFNSKEEALEYIKEED